MRPELTIPNSIRPDLKPHIIALLQRPHEEPEFAADIPLGSATDDAAIQKLFTPARLAHIAKSDAEIDAGTSFTADQVDKHIFDADVRAEIGGAKGRRLPNLEVAETLPIFGIFADNPEFSESIDRVIASRCERYVKFNG